MFTDRPWHVHAPKAALEVDALPPEKVLAGDPVTSGLRLVSAGPTTVEIGIWEHTTGESVDVEADEVFVVLEGRATVSYDDGTAFEIGPGSVVATPEGVASTWTVHETLRKVYLVSS